MPRSQASLRLTDRYRERLVATRTSLQTRAERLWPTIETLDNTEWVERMAAAVTQAQVEAIRLNAAYLGAFLTSELGRRTDPPALNASPYAGKSFDGRSLTESLRSPIVGVLGYLKQGLGASDSLSRGLERATRMVGVDFDHAHRTSLLDAIASDDRFDGWNRSLAGTCGACASVASGVSHELHFQVHPGCFPAGIAVGGPSAVAASKRWYVGDLVELRFRGGGSLACTPNHPILTPLGWVKADLLREGGDVVRSRRGQRGMAEVSPHDDERPAFIEQVAESLRSAGNVASASVPVAPEDFHGDGGGSFDQGQGYVDVVWTHRLLEGRRPAIRLEHFGHVSLCPRHAALVTLSRFRHLGSLLKGVLAPPSSLIGGFGNAAVLLGGPLGSVSPVDRSPVANVDTGVRKRTADGDTGYAVPSRKSLLRFAGEVEVDKLIGVRRYPFTGHVFNLQSSSEQWYTANRTVVHNCQCVASPVVSGVPNTFPVPTGVEIFNEKSQQEQDEMLGPEAANAVRSGLVTLDQLKGESDLEEAPNFITQKPITAITT